MDNLLFKIIRFANSLQVNIFLLSACLSNIVNYNKQKKNY